MHKTRQPSLDKQATPAGGVAIGGRRGLAEPHGEGANRRHCVAAASGRVKCLPAWCSMFHIRGCERAIGSGSGRGSGGVAAQPPQTRELANQRSRVYGMSCNGFQAQAAQQRPGRWGAGRNSRLAALLLRSPRPRKDRGPRS